MSFYPRGCTRVSAELLSEKVEIRMRFVSHTDGRNQQKN